MTELSLLRASSRRPALDSIDSRDAQLALNRIHTRMFGPPDETTLVHSAIARYQFVRRLGAGGMGVVYEAWDPELGRAVAIKRLRSGLGSVTEYRRIVREAQTMAQLDHPNVARVFDVIATSGCDGDEPAAFIVMEYVRGRSLRSWLEDERSIGGILGVFEQAALGLAAVHRAGQLHRDFKLDNVLVEDGSRGPRVKVVDFGLSVADESTWGLRQRVDSATPRSTSSGSVITPSDPLAGTPTYMAPEQLGGRGASVQTDVYAYCVALYIALLGAPPHSGDTRGALLSAKLTLRPSFLGRYRPSAKIVDLLRRGLSPSVAARPASMGEVVRRLRRARTRPRGRRWKAASIVAVMLASALATTTQVDVTEPAPPTIHRGEIAQSAAQGWLRADRPTAALDSALAIERIADDDLRLLASTRLIAGIALMRLDDFVAAERALSSGYFAAIATGRAETALRAALGLCRVTLGAGRLLDGRWWIDAAQPLLDRVGRPPGLAAELLLCRADAAAHTGDVAQAHALTHQAIAALERDPNEDAASHVDRLLRVATYEITGEHPEAAWISTRLASRIARRRLGTGGPSHARARAQLAYVAVHVDRAEHALAIYDDLLNDSKAAVSDDNRVRMLNNRSAIHRALGNHDAAAADVIRARELLSTGHLAGDHPLRHAVATNDAANLLAQQRPAEALEILIPLQVALESSTELPVRTMLELVRRATAHARAQLRPPSGGAVHAEGPATAPPSRG